MALSQTLERKMSGAGPVDQGRSHQVLLPYWGVGDKALHVPGLLKEPG